MFGVLGPEAHVCCKCACAHTLNVQQKGSSVRGACPRHGGRKHHPQPQSCNLLLLLAHVRGELN